ncbi:MAG: ATP-dependent RecD-like DNA helicase, partial [Myxococcales bacterium]|nr:ATP-dependent RecD-like DNA helicase [Myxococcales bacterium]
MATPPPPETLDGALERFTYVNDDGSFAVAAVRLDDGQRLSAVGPLGGLEPGDRVRLVGAWQDNPRFGRQFKAEAGWPLLPESAEGIERYLAGGRVHGVGPELAKRLVATFGADTLTVVANTPERLSEVPGIGPKRRAQLAEALTGQTLQREALVFLQGHGVPARLADQIWKKYEGKTIGWVRENPYRLAAELRGVGFATADRIARSVGLPPDSPVRAAAALIHALNSAQDDGHVCLPRAELLARTEALVGAEAPVALVLDKALAEGRLVDGGDDY